MARSEWLGLDDTVQGEIQLLDLWAGVRGSWSAVTATAGVKWIFLEAGVDEASVDINFVGFMFTIGVQF